MQNKYTVRSTKDKVANCSRTNRRGAGSGLQEQAADCPPHYSFKYYATRFIEKRRQLAARGDRNASFIKTAQVFLDKNQWGLMKHFAGKDVRELKTQHFAEFINDLAKKRPDLST